MGLDEFNHPRVFMSPTMRIPRVVKVVDTDTQCFWAILRNIVKGNIYVPEIRSLGNVPRAKGHKVSVSASSIRENMNLYLCKIPVARTALHGVHIFSQCHINQSLLESGHKSHMCW
jgi:hypothetical protein